MKKMMVLSLVFSVMSLGTAMANDANAMVDAKPKNVHVNINVPPMGVFHASERPCPPPPPHFVCGCNNGSKAHKNNHKCCAPKPPKRHGKPGVHHHEFKPHSKPVCGDFKPHGKPGGAPAGRPAGNHNGAPARR